MTTVDELRKLYEQVLKDGLVKEAKEGDEHRRLREALEGLAGRLDFTRSFAQLGDNFPDVLRTTWTTPRMAFVGDAKDANNQRLADSGPQIGNYLSSLQPFIKKGDIFIAVVMIATNDEAAAQEWAKGLGQLAPQHGLTLKAGPQFLREAADTRTFYALVIVG